ncbi:hypothetical protein [Mycolicibacterium phlei]|jgi:hypothetical protein
MRPGVAIVGAAVLALALVVAPPDPAPAAQAAPRAVQPTVLTFSPTAAVTALQRLVDAKAGGTGTLGAAAASTPAVHDVDPVPAVTALALPRLSLPTPGEVVVGIGRLITPLIAPLLNNPVTGPILVPLLFGPIVWGILGTAVVLGVCRPCAQVAQFVIDLVRGFGNRLPLRAAATPEPFVSAEPEEIALKVEPETSVAPEEFVDGSGSGAQRSSAVVEQPAREEPGSTLDEEEGDSGDGEEISLGQDDPDTGDESELDIREEMRPDDPSALGAEDDVTDTDGPGPSDDNSSEDDAPDGDDPE